MESDTDLTEVKMEHEVHLEAGANTCDTRIEMDRYPLLYPLSSHSYQMLVNYKTNPCKRCGSSQKRPPYNLAVDPEDICIFIMFKKIGHPLYRIESNEVRYLLDDPLRETLRAYEQRGGAVKSERLPDCPDRHCNPYHDSITSNIDMALKEISIALLIHRHDLGHYPTTEEGLAKLKPTYIHSVLLDRWKEPYVYISPDPTQGKDSFLLYSKGPNKIDEQGLGDDIVYRPEAAK